MGRVQGKVVIVTGAASNPGLGYTAAVTLAREGAKVVVTDVDAAGAERCAEDIRKAGGEAISMAQDVTLEDVWKQVMATTVETYGRLDVLVNNAGIAVLKPLDQLSLEDFNRQISVNLTSVFLGCKYAAAEMRKTGGGSLINLSSVAGLVGISTCVAYGASKGGVRLMSKSLAVELGKYGIRSNSVHPGVIWTNMQSGAGNGTRENADTLAAGIPLGRVGEPRDIANCILYLASDESDYVTGAEFTVDAGMTAA
jgi:NAD(P)-dependent dehydrogenase (short-subunit alcohol dehydrogenase family)